MSIIGAGRDQTVFENSTDVISGTCHGGITASNCTGLNFQDLTAKGSRRGVLWIGSGSATWSDVNVVAGNSSTSCGTAAGTIAFATTNTGVASSHQFFGSRVIAQANPTAQENSGVELNGPTDVWFYGGDILARPEVSGSYTTQFGVRLTGSSPIMNVFGTSLRVRTGASGATFSTFHGVRLTSATAQFRMHGGIINTDASGTATITAYGVRNSPPAGFVNTNGTAFEVKAGGSGSALRLAGNSAGFQSPYLWPPGSTIPTASSLNGQDLWVNTDGGESHLMAYDAFCPSVTGKAWRDQLTGACME